MLDGLSAPVGLGEDVARRSLDIEFDVIRCLFDSANASVDSAHGLGDGQCGLGKLGVVRIDIILEFGDTLADAFGSGFDLGYPLSLASAGGYHLVESSFDAGSLLHPLGLVGLRLAIDSSNALACVDGDVADGLGDIGARAVDGHGERDILGARCAILGKADDEVDFALRGAVGCARRGEPYGYLVGGARDELNSEVRRASALAALLPEVQAGGRDARTTFEDADLDGRRSDDRHLQMRNALSIYGHVVVVGVVAGWRGHILVFEQPFLDGDERGGRLHHPCILAVGTIVSVGSRLSVLSVGAILTILAVLAVGTVLSVDAITSVLSVDAITSVGSLRRDQQPVG